MLAHRVGVASPEMQRFCQSNNKMYLGGVLRDSNELLFAFEIRGYRNLPLMFLSELLKFVIFVNLGILAICV